MPLKMVKLYNPATRNLECCSAINVNILTSSNISALVGRFTLQPILPSEQNNVIFAG